MYFSDRPNNGQDHQINFANNNNSSYQEQDHLAFHHLFSEENDQNIGAEDEDSIPQH
jgi:hypothetical protein